MSKIEEVIFEKDYSGERRYVPFGDLPKDLLDTDNIMVHVEEAFYTDNNSHDGYTTLRVYRIREKTEEEKAKDREFLNNLKEKSKKERYQRYLELKKEFEV